VSKKQHNYLVYILSNKLRSVLYIGVTNNLKRRLYEHLQRSNGFANKYNCTELVYYEHFTTIDHAISREKQIKKWNREKKENLVRSINPELRDLKGDL
jgi:putative endonuclease